MDFTDGGANYHVSYYPSQYTPQTLRLTGATSADVSTLPISTWSVNNTLFQVFQLQVGTINNAAPSYPQYVRLTRWTDGADLSQNPYAFQLVGSQTPTGAIPSAGVATYSGQAYGESTNFSQVTSYSSTPQMQQFTASVSFTVDFSKATSASVTGLMNNFKVSSGGDPNLATSSISFSGGPQTSSSGATLNAYSLIGTSAGSGFGEPSKPIVLQGALYGPNAEEFAGVFQGYLFKSLATPPDLNHGFGGTIQGGFVAKKGP